jgi:diamine N-acetyltransferase
VRNAYPSLIDAIYQGRGYGRAAMKLVLAMIQQRYLKCRVIKLTCFRGNDNAAALYKSLGFEMTAEVDPMFKEPVYAQTLKGPRA